MCRLKLQPILITVLQHKTEKGRLNCELPRTYYIVQRGNISDVDYKPAIVQQHSILLQSSLL